MDWTGVSTMADVTDRLVSAASDFLVALRSNQGFQDDLYEALASSLRDCTSEWRGVDSIPRLATTVLVEIVPAAQAVADSYDEPVRQRIMDASFELYDLIIECVAPESG